MNAYELADAIEDWDTGANYTISIKAGKMLREQAKRIEELEKVNQEPVAWGFKDGNTGKWFEIINEPDELDKVCGNCFPLYTHPHKELSDEEIEQCFADSCTEFKLLENGKTKGIVDIIAVGRAIIKASRGEE